MISKKNVWNILQMFSYSKCAKSLKRIMMMFSAKNILKKNDCSTLNFKSNANFFRLILIDKKVIFCLCIIVTLWKRFCFMMSKFRLFLTWISIVQKRQFLIAFWFLKFALICCCDMFFKKQNVNAHIRMNCDKFNQIFLSKRRKFDKTSIISFRLLSCDFNIRKKTFVRRIRSWKNKNANWK